VAFRPPKLEKGIQVLDGPMSGDALESLKAPLGAFEPNVLVAGLEALLMGWLGYSLVTNADFVPSLFAKEWHWSFAVLGLLLLVGCLVLGLIVEGLAGALERVITWTAFDSHRLRPWCARLFEAPDADAWPWAQRWIWDSDRASSEFSRRRLRLLTARNTAFVLLCGAFSTSTGLLLNRPPQWVARFAITSLAGLLATVLMLWVWVAAQQAYHRAVQDAKRTGALTKA
jgi:hypothetical protein